VVSRGREPAGTGHVDDRGIPKPLPFAAVASRYVDTFRLAVRPDVAGRGAIAILGLIARVARQAPTTAEADQRRARPARSPEGEAKVAAPTPSSEER
jgi:hypothetical protein